MKKIIPLFVLLLTLLGNAVFGQTPQGISYQAVARSNTGAILASQPIGLRFSIYDATPTGALLYQETFTTTTTPLGLFNVNVGTGTVVSGTFNGISWGTDAKYLQVEMDPAGGTSYVRMGTAQQMMSVPYSLYSNNGVPNGTSVGDMLYWNGSGWVRIAAGTTGQILTVSSSGIPSWSSVLLLPAIATATVGSITSLSAIGGGSVTGAGVSPVTGYGVCWSTTSGAESVSGAHTFDGSGTGSFSSNIAGLAPGTTYYVRAYATNSAGTAYGSEVSFTTNTVAPTVTTTNASSVTSSGAISGGNVTSSGGASVTAFGVCWSTTSGAESISGLHTTDGSGTGSFISNITGLAPGTTYYVMAYATNSVGTTYGSEVSFTTNAVVPTLATTSAGSITSSSAASGGNVAASGGATVTAYGVCWSTSSGAESVSGAHTYDGTGTGSFISNITGLAPGTTYYVRAYATNSAGTAYGSEVSFTTSAVVPALTTTSASSITSSSAASGGNITSSGGATVTAYGVCWSTTPGAESVSGTHTTNGAGTGSFISNITSLTPGTTYYVMAYATNSVGTAYGSEISFTTSAVIPTLSTTSASSITSSSAASGGNVTSSGGASVTAYGVCWSTTPGTESVSGSHTTDGFGTGSFTSNITGLSTGTTYYVMAYATNSVGTAYGSEINFTTTTSLAPTVITDSVTDITILSFTVYGHVPSSGGSPVVTHGFVGGPTPGNTLLTGHALFVGLGTTSFDTTVTVGSGGTTLYVRAFAINGSDTAYGAEINFTTLPPISPTVTTNPISSITMTSASGGGNVISTGGGSVTRGVCWSITAGGESLSGPHTNDGGGTGSYVSSITSLSPGTTYYVRAYAFNSADTALGNEVSFTTPVTVGMSYGGGTVAYILQPGDPGYDPTTTHGLIASTSDLAMYMQWYNGVAVSTGATGTAIGTGLANTNAIIAAQGSAGCGCYAATLARSYTGGGYTDWYLPSLNELSKLYINMTAIGGFSAANYWSSTEYATGYAWIVYFATGYESDASKSSTNHVRAVRSF